MMLRVQLERQRAGFFSLREYARLYGLDGCLEAMADHAIVMHPGPMNRGSRSPPRWPTRWSAR